MKAVQENCLDNLPDVTPDQFFKTLARVAFDSELGWIGILTSESGKYLGFGVMVDVTEMYQLKTLCIYIVYSNAKCPSTILEVRHEALQWAKQHGFERIRAVSFRIRPNPTRISGAVKRYFSKTLGLRERCVVFEAPIV
jgi:hypothetical protein